MMNYHEQALSALKKVAASGGISISDDDVAILAKKPNEIRPNSADSERLREITDAVIDGFFHCASKGLALIPEQEVTERFGFSIEENYPEANEVFLKFAKTYWTLRVLLLHLAEDDDMEWVGAYMLGRQEEHIGPVFFPFPGRVKIAPSKRERVQRKMLEESGADIDIEEFIRGNPILIRDMASRSGCLVMLLLLLSITILACWGVVWLVT